MKTLIIEQPGLHLEWQKDNGENYICSAIRTNYAKISPLTICSIAKQAGLDVEAVDMKIRDQDVITPYKKFRYGDGWMVASRKGIPFEKLDSKIRESEILAFSVNPTQWAGISLDLVKYAKSINPKIKTIIGGTDALTRFDFYLSKGIDFVVLGEGEKSGKQLFESLLQGKKDYSMIPGIAYIDNGNIKINNRSSKKLNLDERPFFDFKSFKEDIALWDTPIEYWPLPEGASGPIGFIEFSRGCFENCGYCTTPIKNKGYRVENIKSLEKRLDNYREWGIKTLSTWDDNLGSLIKQGKDEEMVEIINLIKDKGFAFEFSQGNMAISYLWDKKKNQPNHKLIESIFSTSMSEGKFVGNYGMFFPFENLQEENPKNAYEKLMSFDKELAILEAVLDSGLESVCYGTILGIKEDNQEKLDRAKNRIHEINGLVKGKGKNSLAIPFCYIPIPKTKFFSGYQDNIVYSIEEYPEMMSFHASPLRTDNFEPHEITQMKIDMEKEILTKKEFDHFRSTGEYYWEINSK